jgi:hypothetical protein
MLRNRKDEIWTEIRDFKLQADTGDTVFRGTVANRRNYRNCSLRLKYLVTRFPSA